MKKVLLLFFIIAFAGCEKDDFEPVYNVPEEFQPIIDTFIIEAKQRGLNYNITNLIVTYDETLDISYCATCNDKSNANAQKIIAINTTRCWNNDLQKETLLFHELGHCFLGRDHDATVLPNGDPKSMMIKNNLSIYSPCVYAFGEVDNCNFVYKRTYYINELFNENTPIPDWAK